MSSLSKICSSRSGRTGCGLPSLGELDRADIEGSIISGQIDLAPLTVSLNAKVLGLPFIIPEKPDSGAVDEEVERTVGTSIRDVELQQVPPSAQG
jgi:hypothetical protein